jgi:hypothetical protein
MDTERQAGEQVGITCELTNLATVGNGTACPTNRVLRQDRARWDGVNGGIPYIMLGSTDRPVFQLRLTRPMAKSDPLRLSGSSSLSNATASSGPGPRHATPDPAKPDPATPDPERREPLTSGGSSSSAQPRSPPCTPAATHPPSPKRSIDTPRRARFQGVRRCPHARAMPSHTYLDRIGMCPGAPRGTPNPVLPFDQARSLIT